MIRATAAVLLLTAPAAANDLERLQGTWTITSIIDHGQAMSPDTIRHEFARDARVIVSADVMSYESPASGVIRKNTIRLEIGGPQTGINLIGADGVATRGLIRFEGQRAIAVFGAPGGERPTEFISRPGDDRMLITLERQSGRPTEIVVTAAAPPNPQPAQVLSIDEQWQRFLVGVWRVNDNDGSLVVSFNGDGTFGATREWRRPARRMFVGDVRMSGRWRVVSGSILATITAASADRSERLNQTLSFRISSATTGEVILVTQDGQVVRGVRTR